MTVRRFASGLVVGKFCPLHRGHQLLLDRALSRCERLLVISYTKPEYAGCAPPRRERWLRMLYPDVPSLVIDDARLAAHCERRGVAPRVVPDNEAPAEDHRHFVAWLLHAVLAVDVDAVFTSEDYGEGFAAVLDAAQRARGGAPVVHVMVDPRRCAVPVSGSQVRADRQVAETWLDARIHRDYFRHLTGG